MREPPPPSWHHWNPTIAQIAVVAAAVVVAGLVCLVLGDGGRLGTIGGVCAAVGGLVLVMTFCGKAYLDILGRRRQ